VFSELVEDVPLSAFSKTRILLVGFGYVQRNSSGKLGEFSGARLWAKSGRCRAAKRDRTMSSSYWRVLPSDVQGR
jgi:hypothetical protein